MTSPIVLNTLTAERLTVEKKINGYWGAELDMLPDDYIACENYVTIREEDYVVKKLWKKKENGKIYYSAKLYHNAIEELSNTSIDRLSLLKSVEDLLTFVLAGSGWTAGTVDIDEIISLVSDRRTSILEALNLLATKCNGELYYHSLTRIVDLKRQIGSETGLHIRCDKNTDYMEREEDSTNLVTRIYPSGPDNHLLNSTVIDDFEDETLYTASGAGTAAASLLKRNLTQGVEFSFAALNETFIRDLGALYVVDLTGHDTATFYIYSETANASGVTFGIGESAYTENTVDTGALEAGCWNPIIMDLSGVAAGDKDAIRYIGFKNLTSGAAVVVVDTARAFSGAIYLDSPNKALYKIPKEFPYFNSAKPIKTQYEKILYPTDDAAVSQEYPTANYGSSASMTIKALTSYVWSPHLKWDFTEIPTGAVIVSATIGLTVASVFGFGAPVGDDVNSYLITADFDQDTLTYNTKPTTDGSNIYTFTMTSTGLKTADFKTVVENWISGVADNYGIILKGTDTAQNRGAIIYSKENATDKPYIKIVYTMTTNPGPVIYAGALQYLHDNEVPALRYKVDYTDLSEVSVTTWEDETINLGDTIKLYDEALGINVFVRVTKITKDILNPKNNSLELANRAATLADLEAKRAKQLSYAMPYHDDERIVDANPIQTGYFGSGANA